MLYDIFQMRLQPCLATSYLLLLSIVSIYVAPASSSDILRYNVSIIIHARVYVTFNHINNIVIDIIYYNDNIIIDNFVNTDIMIDILISRSVRNYFGTIAITLRDNMRS